MKIMFFATASGNLPVKRYLDNLDKRTFATIIVALNSLQSQGMSGANVNVRKLRVGLWELKVGPQRILFTLTDPGSLVLLHAFPKQSQRTPSVELKTALSRLSHLLRSSRPSRPIPVKRPRRPKSRY